MFSSNSTLLLPRSVEFSKEATLAETKHVFNVEALPFAASEIGAFIPMLVHDVHEKVMCSPVLSHADMVRIRDNVLNQYRIFYNNYLSVGGSLDARGMVAQYQAVWNVAEGGSYCTYEADAPLAREVISYLQGSNQIYTNAGNQYAANFGNALSPMRAAYQRLQSAANSATNDIRPTIDAYKAVVASNFSFQLYQGMNATLDSLLSEYQQFVTGAGQLFDQGDARVQGNFEAAFRVYLTTYGQLLSAHKHWDTIDGFDGYNQFAGWKSTFQMNFNDLSVYVVLKKPINDQIFAEMRLHMDDVNKKWSAFPNFVKAMATQGVSLDPNTSINKFYARQLVLNIMSGVGAHFNSTISPGEELIATGLSYQHGGKMPPHSEHKDGKDCDLFSIRFRLNTSTYSQAKTVATVVYLLKQGASRVIYSDDAVVAAANAAVPANPRAVNKGGHTTHLHYDVDSATLVS